MPEQTKDLVIFHKLRIDIASTEIIKIDSNKKSTEITFQKNASIDPIKLIDLIQSDHRFKMNGPDKLKVALEEEEVAKRVTFITKKIDDLKV
jgi:transcription-repair coupling factor (superfamily II helicase)